MQATKINGHLVHFAVSGDNSGAPLVFANSLGTDLRIWDRLVALLPPGLRILRYDMRGHGLSDAPDEPYRMETLVEDAAALMQETGFSNAAFVGLSIGGVVAQGLAASRPDLVRVAVLSNTAAKIGTPEGWADRIATVRADGIEAIADRVMQLWFTPAFHAAHADDLRLWRHMLTRTPRAGYIGCCAAIAGADLREAVATIRQPVLAIGGDGDGSTPADLVRETAARIRDARFELIAGAGHIPCVEQPEATAAAITRFLKETRHV